RCVARPGIQAAATGQPLEGDPVARAAVVGASGFAGALAAALAWRHPHIALEAITARSDVGRRLDDVYPRHRVPLELEQFDAERLAERADVAFVSYPHGAAAGVVAELRAHGLRVVDLSADFRLHDLALHERWYGPHAAPDLRSEAVFGLTELHRAEIADAALVANPGCYATAAILALAPLARDGLIADAVVDAKSGVSGAGRAASETTHFVSADENVNAYGVTGHRHGAEIDQELAALGSEARITFTPHLLPLDQGLLASCYVTSTRALATPEVVELFADAYAGEPFVEIATRAPGVRDVRDTNIASVHALVDPGSRVLVFCAIDNLWKGAAGQAMQNMNLMLGLDEGAGL
ncbi:MAG: N-acetyl-gamma-glutamyl-phosphate reductase, partial [Anaeromyxobacteraceae bacterium]